MSLADEITWIRTALTNQGKSPVEIQAALEQHIRSKPAAEQQAFGAWMRGVASQAAPVPPPQMSPEEIHAFGQQKSSIRDQYANQLAQLNFRRGQTAAEQGYQEGDLGRQFDKFREKLPYAAVRRGVADSGIYKRGLQDYGQDRMRQMGELVRRHQGVLGGFDLQRQGLEKTQASQLADLESRRQVRRSALAQQIRSFK